MFKKIIFFTRSRAVIKTLVNTQTSPKVIDFDSRAYNCERNKNRFWYNSNSKKFRQV